MKSGIRQPQQGRSIEKKNRIIAAGYELFSEVGYHGATTIDIAKRAGVSTGIVYGYFEDKRDIMICVLQIYIHNVCEPVFKILETSNGLSEIVPAVLDAVIKTHEQNAKLHNTLHSLAASDEAVNARFMSLEGEITENFSNRLVALGVAADGIREKVHIAMNIIQSFAHEWVFDKHKYIDYDAMRDMVCKTVQGLFE